MVKFYPSDQLISRRELQSIFIDTFQQQISALERGCAVVRVPRTSHLFERHANMAFHFKPEFFVQLWGKTEFSFPDERFDLNPGEICIMPRGVPHGEIARAGTQPFKNVVVCFYNETVSIHVANRDKQGKPIADDICFYTSPIFGRLVDFLNQICELESHNTPAHRTAAKGLLLAELSLLLTLVQQPAVDLFSETERVFRCQWLIRSNIGDPDLSVEWLAAELHCSADHLSKIFHEDTGERIVQYITRIRLGNAADAITHTPLSVKEIAAASGFGDANYFTKVFRRAYGRSPMKFRQDVGRTTCEIEKEPKVVYSDREEYGFGLRPRVMAKAETRLSREARYIFRSGKSEDR